MSTATILVVSDDPLLLACTETTLEDAGYRVLSGHPAEALGIAHELQPATIVLDRRGPDAGEALWARLHAPPGDGRDPGAPADRARAPRSGGFSHPTRD
jgi:CheY-like chemotaxis protein